MALGSRSRTLKGLRRISALWGAQSELEQIVATHRGLVMNKWKHYFEIYDRHFARFRGRDISLLEIGISGGGSLEIWRKFFGPTARIIGLDNNPDCKRFESPGTRVVIGSQGDAAFLEKLAAEIGPIDILIDDGSHAFDHQLTTFRTLFKHIRQDGLYVCEDLCSSYWAEGYGGGPGKPGTYVEFIKTLIDELNAWYWREDVETESDAFARSVHGMHFYPALLVIEKRAMEKPLLTPVGHTPKAEGALQAAQV
jgi:hypothetical protein